MFFYSDTFVVLITILVVGGAAIGGGIYYYVTRVMHRSKIAKTFDEMAAQEGFQIIQPHDPVIMQIRDRIRSFDDPLLTNIRIYIKEAAHKVINGNDVYLHYYEWEKTKTYIKRYKGRDRRFKEIEFYARSGVYIPFELSIPRMFIRGRLSPEEEEKMELKHGISTPPAKGIPDFDRLFICKGPNSTVVSNVFTIELQKSITGYNGQFPLTPDSLKHLIIYLNDKGMNVAMGRASTFMEMKSLLNFSIMLNNELIKANTKKPDGNEEGETYKIPD